MKDALLVYLMPARSPNSRNKSSYIILSAVVNLVTSTLFDHGLDLLTFRNPIVFLPEGAYFSILDSSVLILERKYAEYGINPNQATVGTGRASVNTKTGLEEFNLSQQDVLKEVASQSIVKSYLENPQGFSRLAGQGLAADPSKPFREGIAAGTAQVKGDFKQYAALYNLLTGKEDEAKIKLEKADALYAEADEITREYTKFENAFDSLSDLGEYSGLQLGKLVPQILTMLGTGFGSAVVYGLGKQGVKSATKKYLQKKSTRLLNKDKLCLQIFLHFLLLQLQNHFASTLLLYKNNFLCLALSSF